MQARKATFGVAALLALGSAALTLRGAAEPETGAPKEAAPAAAPTDAVGLQAGARVAAFDVTAITGAQQGQTLCYVWQNGGKPVTLVFARKLNPDLASLVKAIDTQVAQSEGKSAAFVTFVNDDKALWDELKTFAGKESLTVPLTVAVDAKDVQKKFKVSATDKMPINVLVYKGKKVVKAFALDETITPEQLQEVSAAAAENAK